MSDLGFGLADAEFNSGLALIYQLDGIEKELIIATAQTQRNYFLHYNLLVAYWKTLYPQVTKKEDREKQKKNWSKVKEAIVEIREAQAKKKNTIPQEVIGRFDEWELELRDLKQKYGMGMKKRDGRFALMGQ